MSLQAVSPPHRTAPPTVGDASDPNGGGPLETDRPQRRSPSAGGPTCGGSYRIGGDWSYSALACRMRQTVRTTGAEAQDTRVAARGRSGRFLAVSVCSAHGEHRADPLAAPAPGVAMPVLGVLDRQGPSSVLIISIGLLSFLGRPMIVRRHMGLPTAEAVGGAAEGCRRRPGAIRPRRRANGELGAALERSTRDIRSPHRCRILRDNKISVITCTFRPPSRYPSGRVARALNRT